MEYTVVENTERDAFVKEVNEHLQKGWELHGSLAIYSLWVTERGGFNVDTYVQAMVKRDRQEWTTSKNL